MDARYFYAECEISLARKLYANYCSFQQYQCCRPCDFRICMGILGKSWYCPTSCWQHFRFGQINPQYCFYPQNGDFLLEQHPKNPIQTIWVLDFQLGGRPGPRGAALKTGNSSSQLGTRYLMSIRHSLMRFATPRFREKFTCTFVGTGRNVRYAFLHILPVLQPWWDFPGNYCWRELLLGTHGPSHELRGACGGSRSGQPPC